MIKSILGGKSKNLCDLAYLLTLPLDKTFNNQGFWRVLINAEPNTKYTFSRENANQITEFENSYLAISTYDDITHNYWLSHGSAPVLNHKSTTLTTSSDGKLWILFNENFYKNYWQKNLNPFGYIQLELGSTATEYVPHELTSYKSIMKVSDVCQLVDKSKFTASGTTNGITWVSNGDGSITLNGTCTDGFALNPFNQQIPVDQTHFYYTSPYLSINYGGRIDGTYETGGIGYIKTSAQPTKFNTVFYIWIDKDKSFSNVTTFINIDDLTEIFGAGNEPKTVAEFKAKFPNDYYLYSPSCFVTSYDERMSCKTKNLFSSLTEVGIPSSTKFDKSEKRLLEDEKWYIGLTASNYYARNSVLDYSIMENSVYIKWGNNGYSAAKCIYCEPNTTYSVTKKYGLIQGQSLNVDIGFYAEDGTSILFTADPTTFTTPENCKYITICMTGRKFPNDNFGAGCFSDLQLVKGTTATDYVPFGYV